MAHRRGPGRYEPAVGLVVHACLRSNERAGGSNIRIFFLDRVWTESLLLQQVRNTLVGVRP